jgi:hypothetical protein
MQRRRIHDATTTTTKGKWERGAAPALGAHPVHPTRKEGTMWEVTSRGGRRLIGYTDDPEVAEEYRRQGYTVKYVY